MSNASEPINPGDVDVTAEATLASASMATGTSVTDAGGVTQTRQTLGSVETGVCGESATSSVVPREMVVVGGLERRAAPLVRFVVGSVCVILRMIPWKLRRRVSVMAVISLTPVALCPCRHHREEATDALNV